MNNMENIRIILKDGSVHRYDEEIFVPRNEETEHIYQTIFRICDIHEVKSKPTESK